MTKARRSAVIHGHFYQPPREDPWFETVPRQPSAAPFHDWNERIEHECYRAVLAARVPGAGGRIAKITNALSWMSFDFGPTLLGWLEREAPATYQGVLEADRIGRRRLNGFGGAMAQPYHHTILPLASRREKVTEVRWGVADFRRRFEREPHGMWLPETAVDDETLDVLAQEGLAFTVLAPHQVEQPPAFGMAGGYRTRAGGRQIALFVYDGKISQDIAFGPLLEDAGQWVKRLGAPDPSADGPLLTSMATDGETFGHHRRFGEMALAAVIDQLEGQQVTVENFASFLARNPPRERLKLVEATSWSCVHGVERWRSDCGCKTGADTSSRQSWRAPLRDAMEWLADGLHAVYEEEGGRLFRDPWAARDSYGEVAANIGVEGFQAARDSHLTAEAAGPLSDAQRVRASELLETERNALRLFTSCGWFFDDLGGIEPTQLLRYAARAIELSGKRGATLERGFMQKLERAVSNDPAVGDGRALYAAKAKPAVRADLLAAAAVAAARAVAAGAGEARLGVFAGRADGPTIRVEHGITGQSTIFRAEIERAVGTGLRVELSAKKGAPSGRFSLTDLSEDGVRLVDRALAEALVTKWLPEADSRALCEGRTTREVAHRHALVRAILDLEGRPAAGVESKLMDLLDLLELEGIEVPFDAQTAFWRVWAGASGPGRSVLRGLGYRLGFTFPADA